MSERLRLRQGRCKQKYGREKRLSGVREAAQTRCRRVGLGLHRLVRRRRRVLCQPSVPVGRKPTNQPNLLYPGLAVELTHLIGLLPVGLVASGWVPFVGGLAWGMFSGDGIAVPTLCGAVLPAFERA